MKRCLLTPLMENMTDAAIISSLGDLCTGAPAREAMSASPVASITRLARIASRPALLSVMTPRIAPFSMIGATPSRCSSGVTPASCDQHVGDPLEHLGVERVAQGLRLGHRRAHGLGALLELDADPLAVDRVLVAVPGKALDAHLGDVAAEAAVAVDQRGAGAGARRGQRRGQSPRAAADHQHIGFQNDVDERAGSAICFMVVQASFGIGAPIMP